MMPARALASVVLLFIGSALTASAQDVQAPLSPVPPPPAVSASPTLDIPPFPATELSDVWKSNGENRDYHFYANVGASYMWLHGGSPFSSGPLMGPGFSAGVFNNSGLGAEVKGSEFFQSTTRGAVWEVERKP